MGINEQVINRWRLVLGKFSDQSLEFSKNATAKKHKGQSEQLNQKTGVSQIGSSDEGHQADYRQLDELLDFLYNREYGTDRGMAEDYGSSSSTGKSRNNRHGGKGASSLTVPKWITKIREFFPKEAIEVMERHALERYNLTELLTDKKILESLEPNIDLLKNILNMKHLMEGEVLETARKIVKTVSDDIRKKIENKIKRGIIGKIDRNKRGYVKSIRNIDFKKTIKRNLKNYNRDKKRMLVDDFYFNSRIKHYNPWNLIIALDESGSMADSVIYGSIMAGIFASLKMLKTHLIVFDTSVVDLSEHLDDPVQTLMSVQLGGGTNIPKALEFSYELIENPQKTIVVLVTDLFEGDSYTKMYQRARDIIESGAKLFVIPALDDVSIPMYDKIAAQNLANMGAQVAALTPNMLAQWIGSVIS